jgi:hypothetical protein
MAQIIITNFVTQSSCRSFSLGTAELCLGAFGTELSVMVMVGLKFADFLIKYLYGIFLLLHCQIIETLPV